MKKCNTRTTLQFNLTADETRILLPSKKGAGYIRIGREKIAPEGAKPNYVAFTGTRAAGAPLRRILNALTRADLPEVSAMELCLTSILNGERDEIKGHEMTEFHRGIIERRLASVLARKSELTVKP